MSSKYTQQEILDITKTFIQGNSDADFIQKKMYEGFSTLAHQGYLFLVKKRTPTMGLLTLQHWKN